MKILLYSYTFLPALGGIEIVTATLADSLIKLGHECSVITETISSSPDKSDYKVYRKPSKNQRISLIKSHDLVHSNGASLALFFYSKIYRKPFIWTHGGYQLSCIDGLGWVDGEKAPLTPLKSILFHTKKRGLMYGIIEGLKLYIRRIAGNFVEANVAVTNWVSQRQKLPNQVVIYNPFPLDKFSYATSDKIYDFIYLGRLVSEKGVPELLHAFAQINNDNNKKLVIVGDGEWRNKLEEIVNLLNIKDSVHFAGKKSGEDLIQIVSQSKVAVVPSLWEEPMGGVALEMLAARLNIIVSRNGGLAECVGEAGLKFENGNVEELAGLMKKILDDEKLSRELKLKGEQQIKKFLPLDLTRQYISLYQKCINNLPVD